MVAFLAKELRAALPNKKSSRPASKRDGQDESDDDSSPKTASERLLPTTEAEIESLLLGNKTFAASWANTPHAIRRTQLRLLRTYPLNFKPNLQDFVESVFSGRGSVSKKAVYYLASIEGIRKQWVKQHLEALGFRTRSKGKLGGRVNYFVNPDAALRAGYSMLSDRAIQNADRAAQHKVDISRLTKPKNEADQDTNRRAHEELLRYIDDIG
jgi:hypothetical protein